jgi:glycosyltransferase involved in cell wall biosynthesis
MDGSQIELSIVLPCLNEEKTLPDCVSKAQNFLQQQDVRGEIIVADNGSSDRSVEIARSLGAQVVQVNEKGYGNALRGGFAAAQGEYILMADADDSYDLADIMPFLEKLRQGYELVMGNRFKGGILPGAMPKLHQYFGNPILSLIGKIFFHTPINDFQCGMRAFSRVAVMQMDLRTTGMELASEIVVKASILGMKVCEVPIKLYPDGRDREPHLRSFRDGWRNLRFLLLYSPEWLFLYPGLAILLIGALLSITLYFGPAADSLSHIDFYAFIAAGTFVSLGLSMLSFAVITRVYTFRTGLRPRPPRFFRLFRYITLEKGLLVGFALLLLGLVLMARAVSISSGLAQPSFAASIYLFFSGSLALSSGAQVIFASFVLSMLVMRVS